MAVAAENCDTMNLYRWPKGAHVKNLEIDPRLLCTGQKWSYLCSLLVRFCLLRSPFRDAVNGIYLGLGAINDEKAAIIADNEINALV